MLKWFAVVWVIVCVAHAALSVFMGAYSSAVPTVIGALTLSTALLVVRRNRKERRIAVPGGILTVPRKVPESAQAALIERFAGGPLFGATAEPDPPENVVLILDDETRVPVDCTYDGLRDDGIHEWVVLVPDCCQGRVARVAMDRLPAKTGLRLVVTE